MTTTELRRITDRLTTHSCGRCGRTLREGNWQYYRVTDRYFCENERKCEKRAQRRSSS